MRDEEVQARGPKRVVTLELAEQEIAVLLGATRWAARYYRTRQVDDVIDINRIRAVLLEGMADKLNGYMP